jgi:ATP-dependent exoDNAse (exonuclease V) beta subunit
LEGGESCVVAERLFRQKQGAEEGTIFHALFETLEWLPLATQAEAAAVRHLERFALGEVVCARFIGEWRRMLAAPKVSSLLQKATYEANGRSCELFRELPFVHRDGQQLLRGAMDRVVVSRRGEAVDTVTILDYKTDSIELSQLAERTELYRPQIEVYKKAAQRIFGVESKRVVGKLLFTRVGEVTEL